jgi:hypothetical protein
MLLTYTVLEVQAVQELHQHVGVRAVARVSLEE